ncbi:hypothetical protein [Desulfosporosinus sp. FKB]|uniref:hypothetical protein n=1 Tax=Desulfosporosinus sp. FKB TaxID=1969835 RepID=UPI000B499B97|nr:hypothetical protein [Desulfosporosinus sp. FKB]
MSNELAVKNEDSEIMPGFMSLKSFEFTQRAATLLANSSLVPKDYQNNIPNCVIALNMASRMGADPLMVMQNLFIVYGRPGWSSQFLISTFNTSGRFSSLRYEWIGKKGTDQYGCKAWAIEKATGEKLEGSTVTIEIAKKEGWYTKNGSKWQTMQEQMLMYRAASWFIRAYAPEMAMGMHTTEEIIDIGGNDPEIVIDQNANKGPIIDIGPESEPEPSPETEQIEDKPEHEAELQQTLGPDF